VINNVMQNDRDFMESIIVYTNVVNTLAFERSDCMCHAERTQKGNKKFWPEKAQAWVAQKEEKNLEIHVGKCKLY